MYMSTIGLCIMDVLKSYVAHIQNISKYIN
jgi:hypothetical protein